MTKPDIATTGIQKAKARLRQLWQSTQGITSPVDWAQQHRIIPGGDSMWPGPFSYQYVPYMREIAECFSVDSPVREVAFKKGSQVMGTTCITENIIGYYIQVSPANIMMVSSSVNTIEANMQPRLLRMIYNSPLRKKLLKATRKEITFVGGKLFMAGANNPDNFRNISVRILILEELTGYPPAAKKEGSTKELAKNRTKQFESSRKILYISSALNNGDEMDSLFLEGDCRYYFVPCPYCAHRQRLFFEQLKYELDERGRVQQDSVRYQCESCKNGIDEHHKTAMFAQGQWLPTSPENLRTDYRSYHLSALYSPLGLQSWHVICQQFEEARRDSAEKMRVFYNTTLGENFSESVIAAPSLAQILGKSQDGRLVYTRGRSPVPILYATVGVDVQQDRLEVEVVGWCADKVNYSINYYQLAGDSALLHDSDGCWAKLTTLLNCIRKQKTPFTCLIDAGYNPTQIYDYVQSYAEGQWVFPIIGETPTAATWPYKIKPVEGYPDMMRLHINTPYFKTLFFSDSFQPMPNDGNLPPRYVGLPADYPVKHQERLYLSERPDSVRINGKEVTRWTQVKKDNHPLDARVYAMAGAFWQREFISKTMLGLTRTDSSAAENYFAHEVGAKILDLQGAFDD